MKKIAYVLFLAISLSGCNSINKLLGSDPDKKDDPPVESPRVFGQLPGAAPTFRFLDFPGLTKTFQFEQTGTSITGEYFDGTNTYDLAGTVSGASASFTVTGPGCTPPTSMKIHYVPGIVNYHFVVDTFTGCGVSAPPEDFCIENYSLCGSGL